jgi:hypothetical protein
MDLHFYAASLELSLGVEKNEALTRNVLFAGTALAWAAKPWAGAFPGPRCRELYEPRFAPSPCQALILSGTRLSCEYAGSMPEVSTQRTNISLPSTSSF